MPAVYADHPFAVIPTPSYPHIKNGEPVRLESLPPIAHQLIPPRSTSSIASPPK